VRIDGGVGAEDERCAGPVGTGERPALNFGRGQVLLQKLERPARSPPFGLDEVTVVDIHHQAYLASPGQLDPFRIDEGGVLDGVRAGPDGFLNGSGAVGVGGELLPGAMGHLGDRGNLLGRHLRGAGVSAEGQDGARGDDFEHIGASVDRGFRLFPELLRPPGHARATALRDLALLPAGHLEVTSASGYRQIKAGHLHAGSGSFAPLDEIAQISVGPGDVGADVANRGEPGPESTAGVLDAPLARFGERAGQENAEVGRVLGRIRKMRVQVDESGEDGVGREIEDRAVLGHRTAGDDGVDSTGPDEHGDPFARSVRLAVDEPPANHGQAARRGQEGGEQQKASEEAQRRTLPGGGVGSAGRSSPGLRATKIRA
jgi:hypothetical protein